MLARRVRLLVAATITYNVIEAVVAITAGTIASSTALIGFGLDSVIEVSSAAAVAWQFTARRPRTPGDAPRCGSSRCRSSPSPRYVTVESVRALLGADRAEHSTVGIVLAAVSPARHAGAVRRAAPRRPGARLRARRSPTPSRPCCAPTCPRCCWSGWPSTRLFGWSWADPIAALVIAAVAVKEGREAWRGDTCCAPAAELRSPAAAETVDGCPDSCRNTGEAAARPATDRCARR